MTAHFVETNGIRIAYRIEGKGPPLVLVMGYRLSSAAWPAAFIAALADRFTVITFDNRGTGHSDKPVEGYALANMARDISGLLDALQIPRVHLLGYSMGGAIAQEFIRQFPDRVETLMLCATMCGGAHATYARADVTRVMREIDGLSPEEIARRIRRVTYAPAYLAQHQALAEAQTRREIAAPTPLHAADLQFQAFAEFDGALALTKIPCSTLVMTGDLDELIPPQNSNVMAGLIPDARLVIIPGGGHRVLWEMTDICVDAISGFHDSLSPESVVAGTERAPVAPNLAPSAGGLFTALPLAFMRAAFESMAVLRTTVMVGSASRFGDGKPVILLPRFSGSDLGLVPFVLWLKALGYRPAAANLMGLDESAGDQSLSRTINTLTRRIGRKAVLIAHASDLARALRAADAHRDSISDVVVFDARHQPGTGGVRVHVMSSDWPTLLGVVELPGRLRNIGIELLDTADLGYKLTPKTG